MSTRRLTMIGGVALLHVLIIYALVSGMAQKFVAAIPPMTVVDVTPEAPTKQPPPPPAPKLPTPQPTAVTVVTPVIDVAPTEPPTITAPPQPPTPATPTIADAYATGLTNTHTTPPYPPLESKLGHQGTVVLQLIVSAQGNVASATVVQSSGFPALDQAAIGWVQAHWRYSPAIQGGVAVPSQTRAAVKFDLRQVRG